MDIKFKTLAERLRYARNRKGFSMDCLAKMAGVTRSVIQKAELGGTEMPRGIKGIADASDVSPAWLAFGIGEFDNVSQEAVKIALAWDKLPKEVKDALTPAIIKE